MSDEITTQELEFPKKPLTFGSQLYSRAKGPRVHDCDESLGFQGEKFTNSPKVCGGQRGARCSNVVEEVGYYKMQGTDIDHEREDDGPRPA